MKNTLTPIFVTLGVIFSVLLVGALSIYFYNQYSTQSFSKSNSGTETTQVNTNGSDTTSATEQSASKPSFLSESQRQALASFGIDPSSLPATLTAAQMACFESTLGASRVAEIKAGASPSAVEFFKAKGCI